MRALCCLFGLLATLSPLAAFASTHPALAPSKPPAEPQTEDEIKLVKTVLAEGERQRVNMIASVKRSGSPTEPVTLVQLRELTRSRGNYLPRLNDPQVGQVGVFANLFRLADFKVYQVIDEETMLITLGSGFYMVKGFPTRGIADDDRVLGLASPLQVTGTKTYKTTSRTTRTVMLLEPFPFVLKPQGRSQGKAKSPSQESPLPPAKGR